MLFAAFQKMKLSQMTDPVKVIIDVSWRLSYNSLWEKHTPYHSLKNILTAAENW